MIGVPHVVRRTVCALAAVAVLRIASTAHATNGNTPRTPALFPPHACVSHVDRSVDAQLHFDVTIPFEDVSITPDELPDSRTFQFFALCHDDHRLQLLPNWISDDDAMRALELGIIPALPDPSDVLDGNPHWAQGHDGAEGSCVQTINAERMPISCAATSGGVDWDTTSVPAGNYVIRGYTFAPAINMWTTRYGVVQVADDDAVAPVVGLFSPLFNPTAYQQSGYRVVGCMGGPVGTTVTLSWAATSSDALDDEASWTSFAELDAAAGEIDELLVLPESAIYLGLIVRGVARAADGATWTGYAPGFITVLPGDDASDPPELGPGADHCDVGGDSSGGVPDGGGDATTSGGAGSSSDAGTSGVGEHESDTPGCGCRAERAAPRPLLAALVGLLLVLRRRRPAFEG
jgi:MYXO-CTERM domain-containing protein